MSDFETHPIGTGKRLAGLAECRAAGQPVVVSGAPSFPPYITVTLGDETRRYAPHHETPDVAELRRMAEAANRDVVKGATYERDWPLLSRAVVAFAREMNPDVVLGLLDRLAHMTEARDNARAEVERLTAKVERVRALADEWTYNGEFGWDDGSHAYGPDCEGQTLDYAADQIRRALDEDE